jgi:TonB family protein
MLLKDSMKVICCLICTLLLWGINGARSSGAELGQKLRLHVPGVKKVSAPAVQIRDKWAVLVSVGRYQDPSIKPIKYAARNAFSLAKVLKDPNQGRFLPDHVVTIVDTHATKTEIKDAISGTWLVKKALPNDLIVIYLCGRIVPALNKSDVMLCAYDTLASEAELSGIPLRQMLSELKHRTQSQLILCLLDLSPASKSTRAAEDNSSQASAGHVDSAAPSFPSLSQWANGTDVTVLSATELGKPSHESGMTMMSYFVHYLTEGLSAAQGMTSLGAIAQYVRQNVESDVRHEISKTQTPSLIVSSQSPNIEQIALGVRINNANYNARNFAIGHPIDQLALKRPDLLVSNKAAAQDGSSKNANDEDDEDSDQGACCAVDFGSYMAKMKKDIQAKWTPPKGFEDRRVVVVFSIMRDGSIRDADVIDGSGVDAIDKAALQALTRSSPLQPLPKGAPKSVRIRYQFDWQVKRQFGTQ